MRTSSSWWLVAALAAAGAAATGCGGGSHSQFVVVAVSAGPTFPVGVDIAALSVTLTLDGSPDTERITGIGGGPVTLPADFSAELSDTLAGDLTVTIVALDGADVELGGGAQTMTLSATGTTTFSIQLVAGGGMGVCGDGTRGAGEECDGGDLAGMGCTDLGFFGGTLACDGACDYDTSGCTAPPGCGDGTVDGVEECDDGPLNGPGADCTPVCRVNVCGDGFPHATNEGCDDGVNNGFDADCTPVCTVNVCGDGYPHATNEECDNGVLNAPAADCTPDCTVAACGDGWVHSTEQCDDGNTTSGDGCSAVCLFEAGGVCSFDTSGDFVGTAGTVLSAGTYDYVNFMIPAGVTVTVTGSVPLEIWAETVTIDGTLLLRGSDGANSGMVPASIPNGGGAGPGGGGGGGGSDCGNGTGLGGFPNGMMPLPGGDGGNGGLAAFLDPMFTAPANGGGYGPGGGGGGGGSALAGADGEAVTPPLGVGGAPYSDPFMSIFTGGGGGAGGAANGGGGGGGGGAVRIIASSVDIGFSGVIDASGGAGGIKTSGSCTSGGGGGGGGGMIWLEADTLIIDGTLLANGGAGGAQTMISEQFGGAGAPGRVQLSSPGAGGFPGLISPPPFIRFDPPACRF